MVDDLQIMCKYFKEGCDKLFKVGELKQHSDTCIYYPLICQNSGCDFIGARHLMRDHSQQCEYKTEICQKGCQKVLKQSEIINHNCIASLTAEVKMLRANEELLRDDVIKQQESIKELSCALQLKNYIHENIACYECNMDPIKTDRFKCQQCQDFDICLYCYCRGSHPKTHKFTVLGPLGVAIIKESDVAYFQKRGQILKKEIFFRNMGEELELTVRPYNKGLGGENQQQPVHLSEFQSTYIQVPQNEYGSVYFHFIVQNDDGKYSAKFRLYCRKRNEYFGMPITINYQVSGVSVQQ
ncbi:e3 ubiquitin-protein ligase nrdp1-like [Stylonychia lemnae]|uniref:E3 ubiquitin-protein ligase nrdp1-like n=1 Tax=Stylonychia lemnae TaxID=5949 RepID=A0A078AVY9_STYLE|nr:e3 ubiquitin-protein ligase nrdp1-like [Stylonychia lemnae]|eukprot:CDW86256.1 e3 ubiquitin-protein ligase nrdp1-like [Stylonychia lemnae]